MLGAPTLLVKGKEIPKKIRGVKRAQRKQSERSARSFAVYCFAFPQVAVVRPGKPQRWRYRRSKVLLASFPKSSRLSLIRDSCPAEGYSCHSRVISSQS